ncbi:indolepyruvate ferredoxin oxidoreductase family protein [Thiomonas delicata]|uniref:Putative Indolepyruvate ferredoxin oxidoreductase n=1 Tax=Thiomonas delicata TaxID=364030 RepID=A0A238D114_THIDL|nr:indolepyruvate ferredoxin oxidoreductase family protein [Thiomonas delicata]SBP86890.1 putative Indolepyruvate ferredoxin oxidoreductase [Thiomonas delicata]
MNAPLPEAIRRALETVSLDDKYTLETGRAFMSGIHALVRLPMLQRQRDALAGLNTAGFVSGYRGSPLGGYDQALWKAKKQLAANNVVFQAGVNEELAATALWGTQQLDLYPGQKKFDGVFGIWYGKGPGVDRCSDVFKHANMAGTAKHGGVIAVAGDDHVAKSSTAAHQSDHIFKACGLPVFFPSNVQDILDLGLHALAMSRYSGVWAGMKTIQEVVESSASVDVAAERVRIVLPTDFEMPQGGVHIRWPDDPLSQEARLMDVKWYAALAYIRANRLNHTVIDSPHARLGIMASGKAYNDTRQALADMGLDDATCAQLGIRLHKVAVVWPLEAAITREFATGLQEILVVEEKRQVIEYQLKEELYNWREDVRPNVIGKFDERAGDRSGGEWSQPNPGGNWLLPAKGDLSPSIIAKAIASRLEKLGILREAGVDLQRRLRERVDIIVAKERALEDMPVGEKRPPWFCSGCPHNTSTRVPEGSRGMAGIGCHYMVVWMDRQTATFSQMGGEGVAWVGQAPFTKEKHVFANLGDGTYYHSGLLAIRQAISAKVNITYKILFNDAVAMTGGQPVEGGLTVPQITRELQAEGVREIVVVTDEPQKYRDVHDLAPGVTVHHRDELDAIQLRIREVPGTTVIVYDQTCATEKRRRRKRGLLADPAKRVVINPLVCEGCGDCSEQSNCLSVEPLETEFGRKRTINQSTCNKDYSCLKGFCPSFVTVEGGQLRKPKAQAATDPASLPPIPEPVVPDPVRADRAGGGNYGILVAGVGGTGVITIGQLLGVAAHIEGKGIVTQDAAGLAQKGGATWSHVLIADAPENIHTTRVAMAEAELILGCDPIVAADRETLSRVREGRTFVALNTHGTPTATFVHQPDWQFPGAACRSAIEQAAGREQVAGFDAEAAAVRLLGDALYANPMLLGFAWQKGWLPLGHASLMRAIELNAVAVDKNKAAFEWGRRAAADPQGFAALASAQQVIQVVKRPSLDELVKRRVEFLTGYQNAAYARQYAELVAQVRAAEAPLQSTRLSEAVARHLFKLMAYKDEYEVARLHSAAEFGAQIQSQFEGDFKLRYHLAPPLLAKRNAKGELVKREFGSWMGQVFAVLRHFKFLRGTAIDPFGRTDERKQERALIGRYRDTVRELLGGLNPQNLALAVQIASLPERIRGYGHVKARNLAEVEPQWEILMRQWRHGGAAGTGAGGGQARVTELA